MTVVAVSQIHHRESWFWQSEWLTKEFLSECCQVRNYLKQEWNKEVLKHPWVRLSPYNWWSAQRCWLFYLNQWTATWIRIIHCWVKIGCQFVRQNWQVPTDAVRATLVPKNQDSLWLCHCITLKKEDGACASQTMDGCGGQLHPLDFHCPFVGALHWQKGRKKGSSNTSVIEQRPKEVQILIYRNQPKGL